MVVAVLGLLAALAQSPTAADKAAVSGRVVEQDTRTPIAGAQVMLATTAGLTPWKGGGFGMFATTDDGGRRYVRIFVSAPERSEEITVPPSLSDAARRAAALPGDTQLARLARGVVDRERRRQRPVDVVRIETWRIEYARETLAATPRRTRE